MRRFLLPLFLTIAWLAATLGVPAGACFCAVKAQAAVVSADSGCCCCAHKKTSSHPCRCKGKAQKAEPASVWMEAAQTLDFPVDCALSFPRPVVACAFVPPPLRIVSHLVLDLPPPGSLLARHCLLLI